MKFSAASTASTYLFFQDIKTKNQISNSYFFRVLIKVLHCQSFIEVYYHNSTYFANTRTSPPLQSGIIKKGCFYIIGWSTKPLTAKKKTQFFFYDLKTKLARTSWNARKINKKKDSLIYCRHPNCTIVLKYSCDRSTLLITVYILFIILHTVCCTAHYIFYCTLHCTVHCVL